MEQSSHRHRPPAADARPIDRLLEIMRVLRSPTGCPWDLKQTLATLKEHLVEESHEVLDAIDSGDRNKLKEELGDLLLQVVFQSQLCSEEGAFNFEDVAQIISEKLIRRHPHVFGDVQVSGADEVLKNWEAIKKSEKKDGARKTLEGVPKSLPALSKAQLVQKRAARVGFDWENIQGALDKAAEELDEVKEAVARDDEKQVGEELGDLLFAAVNICRFSGHNPEELLQQTIQKFTRRFEFVENAVHQQGKQLADCPLNELERYWQQAKLTE